MGATNQVPARNKKLLSYMVGAGVAASAVTADAVVSVTNYDPPLTATDTDPVNSLQQRDDMMLPPLGAHEAIFIDLPTGVGTVEGPPPFGDKMMGPPAAGNLLMLPGDTKERAVAPPPKGAGASNVKSITKPGGLVIGAPGVEVTKLTGLPPNTLIDENAPWATAAIIGQGFKKGGFVNPNGDRYLGVRMDLGGGDYLYGWIRYRLGSIEAHELQFETEPNRTLRVPSAEPVPVTYAAPLATLALGAAGLAALRRRRKQQQAA